MAWTTKQIWITTVSFMALLALVATVLLLLPKDHRRGHFESIADFSSYAESKGMHRHNGQRDDSQHLRTGAYFSFRRLTIDDVSGLIKLRQTGWDGIVWCEDAGSASPANVHYRTCGKVRLMGDPELIRELIP